MSEFPAGHVELDTKTDWLCMLVDPARGPNIGNFHSELSWLLPLAQVSETETEFEFLGGEFSRITHECKVRSNT